MAEHNVLGQQGEEAAARYLVMHGYHIVERDWHCGHRDIDIIAQKQGIMVFVEVKTRSSEDFGVPQDSVDDAKMRNVLEAANAYVLMNKVDIALRFDIVAVIKEGTIYKIKHYPDAFGPSDWTPKYEPYKKW